MKNKLGVRPKDDACHFQRTGQVVGTDRIAFGSTQGQDAIRCPNLTLHGEFVFRDGAEADVTQMQVQGGNVQAVRETRSTYTTTQAVAWSGSGSEG